MLISSLARFQCVDEMAQKTITEDRRDRLMAAGYTKSDDYKRLAMQGSININDPRLKWDEVAYIRALLAEHHGVKV